MAEELLVFAQTFNNIIGLVMFYECKQACAGGTEAFTIQAAHNNSPISWTQAQMKQNPRPGLPTPDVGNG